MSLVSDKGSYRPLEKLDEQARLVLKYTSGLNISSVQVLRDVTSRLRSLFKSKFLDFCEN